MRDGWFVVGNNHGGTNHCDNIKMYKKTTTAGAVVAEVRMDNV